jgi:hypothetical protein
MRIRIHFTADNIIDHLYQIEGAIEQGRTFGSGWCLIGDDDACPVMTAARITCPRDVSAASCRHALPA